MNKEMLQQIHNRLKAYRLREGAKSADDFKVIDAILPSSIKTWQGKSNKEIFTAAADGQKSALEYIFWKMEPAIQGAFWTRFLGPNGTVRRYRIQAENAWEDWLGIAWMTLTGGFDEMNGHERAKGMFDGFDIERLSEDKLLPVFASRYKLKLGNAAMNANRTKMAAGISGREVSGGSADINVSQYEPTWTEGKSDWNPDNDDTNSTGESYEDETFDKVNDKIWTEKFLAKWTKFVQDPGLQKNVKGISAAQVLFEVIDNENAAFPKMTQKFGIARNSIAQLLTDAQTIMSEKYTIPGQDLIEAIRILGNEKVASYLNVTSGSANELPSVSKGPPNKTVVKADNAGSSFETKFAQALTHEKMWYPHKFNTDAGNCLYMWIDEGYPTPEKLATEYGLRADKVEWYLDRAFKILKKNNISQEDIKNAVKSKGKKAIMDLIGED